MLAQCLIRCSTLLRTTCIRTTPSIMSKVCQFSTDDNANIVKEIYKAALRSVHPSQMVRDNLLLQADGILKVGTGTQQVAINLDGKNCYVVAFGKAVIGMVAAVESILGEKITSGVASIPTNIQSELIANGERGLLPSPESKVRLCEGAYLNIPDEACLRTSTEIKELVTQLTADDIIITLTSGGGSALLCLPVPPLSLDNLADITRSLAKAGASIVELNTVRKHLEILKGGGLAHLAQPAQVVNLILSDIVGDPIDCIASGPTVVDTSTSKDAIDIIEKYLSQQRIHPTIMDVLRRDLKAASLGRPTDIDRQQEVHNIIIGSNNIALQSTVNKCHDLSVLPLLVTSALCGDAAKVGKDTAELSRRIMTADKDTNYMEGLFTGMATISPHVAKDLKDAVKQSREDHVPLCLLFGGETTVEVKGSGKGGRNQEMCLSALISMNNFNLPDDRVTLSSIGTDGQDGPTDAAGACITPQCMLGSLLDAQAYLNNNDSYSYFSQLNEGSSLVRTGLTGTNVMDITILLLHP